MHRVLDILRERYGVDRSSLQEIERLVSPCRFRRKELLVTEGECVGKAFFIASGMTRSYWMEDGEQFTTSFSFEGSIVFSMDELYYGRPSEEFVEAVEDVDAFALSISDLRRLWNDDLSICRWALKIHQDEYRSIHESHRQRLTLPARERYEAFCRRFPEVARRARLGDIASYLGISASTLSRLRRLRD